MDNNTDWLRAVQFSCNTSAKSVTPVQIKSVCKLQTDADENNDRGFRYGNNSKTPKNSSKKPNTIISTSFWLNVRKMSCE